jgi:threonine dehydrogenase-like Zn-dependent dehydrogenase
MRVNPDVRQPMATTNKPLYSTNEFMKACTWQGTEQVTLEERPKPMITDQTDAIVRMESVTLCGSDLHLYTNSLDPAGAMMKGDILGHEGVGVVEAVGTQVKNVKPGDKVVISFGIACGSCEYCQREEYTSCDRTNPSSQLEQMYGHRVGAAFGYSHLTGGYDGLQAEYARVPFADVNLFVVPKDTPLQNDQLIMLSDIACTGWHGAECARVCEGDDVGIWGAGPVGLMAAMWCKYRGAKRVLLIDNEQYRLDRARSRLGVEILNFDDLPGNKSLTDTIMEMFPRGLDACIDCVGFRFPSTLLHKVERVLRLETDALDVIDQMSIVTRKWGRIALIGDYFGYGNHFPIGRIMEKSINILGGQALAQKYWKQLYDIIAKGDVDPAFVTVSHVLPFSQIVKAYEMFNKHQDEALKIILEIKPMGTSATTTTTTGTTTGTRTGTTSGTRTGTRT